MVGKENLRTEDLNLCFEKPMMLVAGDGMDVGAKGVQMDGGVLAGWKDIPMELLLQILSLVDDRTVIVASGVCRGWRDAICFGLAHLSLSWYFLLTCFGCLSLDAFDYYLVLLFPLKILLVFSQFVKQISYHGFVFLR